MKIDRRMTSFGAEDFKMIFFSQNRQNRYKSIDICGKLPIDLQLLLTFALIMINNQKTK